MTAATNGHARRARSRSAERARLQPGLLDPPAPALDAERGYVGALLVAQKLDDVLLLAAGLPAEAFADPLHRDVLIAARAVAEAGDDPRPPVARIVERVAEARGAPGAEVSRELAPIVAEALPWNAQFHAREIAEAHARRTAWFSAAAVLQRLAAGDDAETAVEPLREASRKIGGGGKPSERPRAAVRFLDTVERRPIRWTWPHRVARGKLTLLVGDPGLGKSFVTLDMASRVSTGEQWPDGGFNPGPAGVVLLNAEDDAEDTIAPRLDAMGADCGRIAVLDGVRRSEADEINRTFDLTCDLPLLAETIDAVPGCRLAVVDPITAYLGATDSHKNAEVRGVLAALSKLAAEKDVAVVAVSHLNKAAGQSAVYRTMGSLAFAAAARAVWGVVKDQDDENRRLLLPIKSNIFGDVGGLAFTIEQTPGGEDRRRVAWLDGRIDTPADEALAPRERKPGPDAEAHDSAVEWLRAALAGGPRPAKELFDEWRNGEGGSEKTLKRAKQSLGAEAYREKVPGPWWWRLPGKEAKSPTHQEPDPLGPLAKNAGISPVFEAENPKEAKFPERGPLGFDDETDDA